MSGTLKQGYIDNYEYSFEILSYLKLKINNFNVIMLLIISNNTLFLWYKQHKLNVRQLLSICNWFVLFTWFGNVNLPLIYSANTSSQRSHKKVQLVRVACIYWLSVIDYVCRTMTALNLFNYTLTLNSHSKQTRGYYPMLHLLWNLWVHRIIYLETLT